MDEDLHAALFGEGNEEFEELDDDFVGQVIPLLLSFLFDLHAGNDCSRNCGF